MAHTQHTQRAIEKAMLAVRLRYHIKNKTIRRKTRVKDVIGTSSGLKWSKTRKGKIALKWCAMPTQAHKRGVRRPGKQWLDDVKE